MSALKKFHLHRRDGIWYAQIIDPLTGKRLSARSTQTKDRDEAMLIAAEWLKSGIPTKTSGTKRTRDESFTIKKILSTIKQPGFLREDAEKIINALRAGGFIDSVTFSGDEAAAQDFIEFLTRFWDYKVSPYVKEKNAHGQRIGMRHCYECTLRLKRHWTPYFKGRQIGSITKKDLKSFALKVAESGLAKATINQILNVGFVALRWAHDNDIIREDPTVGVMRFSGEAVKRGVLTEKEAEQLFKIQWNDERACIASLVAATTGLRAGEIRALRMIDIEDTKLLVRRAWSKIDGEKSTKTNKERSVPLIPSVRDALRSLASKNPHGVDGYIFCSVKPDEPAGHEVLDIGFRDALTKIGITAEIRKERNITFHSWRHFFSARMADRVTERQARLATGHESEVIFQGYADHERAEDFQAVAKAAEDAFKGLYHSNG